MSTKEFNPEVVASSFIKQFYEILAKSPNDLYRFYKEDSTFTHCESQEHSSSVTGLENIRNCVADLKLAGSRVDISEGSLDAHASENNGILIVATGLFTPRDSNTPKPFVQTFFLANSSQNDTTVAYHLRNSVFRIIERTTNSVEYQEVAVPNVVTPQKSEASSVVEEPTPEAEAEPVEEVVEIAPETEPEEVLKPSVVVEPVETTSPVSVQEPIVEEAPAAVVEETTEKPKSFLEALNNAAKSKASQQAKTQARQRKTKATSPVAATAPVESEIITTTATTVPNPSTVTNITKSNKSTTKLTQDKLQYSIFIRSIPDRVTQADLLTLFSSYGKIIKFDVHAVKGFGFVEYEEKESAQRILSESPVKCGESELTILQRNIPVNSGLKQNRQTNKNTTTNKPTNPKTDNIITTDTTTTTTATTAPINVVNRRRTNNKQQQNKTNSNTQSQKRTNTATTASD